jgi:hypothetical protein
MFRFILPLLFFLAACNTNTTNPPTTLAPIVTLPTPSATGAIVIPFGGSLANTTVFGPAGNICVGQLQSQSIAGTTTTTLEFVRAQHVRIDVTGGTYTTSFQAAAGCGTNGSPNLIGPVLGPTTVTFSFTYVGAYVVELNPICVGKSFLMVTAFNTPAGSFLDAQAQASFRNQQHLDMDRRLAVAMHDYFNGGNPPVTTPRCGNWVPLAPSEVGL